MTQVIVNDLDAIKKEYGKKRRTIIENTEQTVYVEKKAEEMDVFFMMDKFGYARTIDMATYERNREAAHAENKYAFVCKNTGRVCVFTDTGLLHTIKVSDLPFGKFRDKGIPIDNVSNYNSAEEQIICVASQSELNLYRVAFVTKQSMMKMVDGGEFDVSKRSVASTKLSEGDTLVSVAVIREQRNIVLQSADGYFLRFPVEEIPEKKKGAVGVRGMKLSAKDSIYAVYYTQNAVEQKIEYKDKELELNKIKLGKRDGKGVKVRA
jgi:DNA gyrase subunit A